MNHWTPSNHHCATPTKIMISLLHHINTYFARQDEQKIQEITNFKLPFDYRRDAPFILHLYVDGYTKTRRLRTKDMKNRRKQLYSRSHIYFTYILFYISRIILYTMLKSHMHLTLLCTRTLAESGEVGTRPIRRPPLILVLSRVFAPFHDPNTLPGI